MKSGNRRLILNIIKKTPVSRAELARKTGLTRAAVTLIVDELVRDGILIESGTMEAGYGRKPVLLDLNPASYYAAGLSLTRVGCRMGIMDIKGNLLISREADIANCDGADKCLEWIADGLRKMIDKSALPAEKLLGLGISAPGPVDIVSGEILNPPNFDQWHNVNIVNILKKYFNFDIYLENNSASLALAEKNYGRGMGFNSFMLLVVDTGIGAGIIINDRLYRGVGGFGSEVGHTSIDIHGIPCKCGNRGCLEVYASIPSAVGTVRNNGGSVATWRDIVDGALAGDKICREAVDRESLYLSAGITNAMNILELEAVILAGNITYKPQMLLDGIREYVGNSAITRNIRRLQIMNSSIEKNHEVISAASIIIEKYFRGEIG